MKNYLLRRLALIFPTLFGIMVINFAIVQFAPGGPVEQAILRIQNHGSAPNVTERFTGGGGNELSNQGNGESGYRGSQGIPPELIETIKKQYGFDQPAVTRFFIMVKNYLSFNFGSSFFRDATVIELIKEKLPVSISLGLWSTLLTYLISIPLGIQKAVSHGSKFDVTTSSILIVGYAIPNFLFAILLIVLFSGGTYFDLFPLRGLISDNFEELSFLGKVGDYFWHLALPLTAYTIGGFATLTLLSKNSFLEEINKQYVITAKAKGISEKSVLYGHIFRNAMLIVIALIEVVFSLDGIGLMGYEAVLTRDYPVVFGTMYIFTLISLVLKIVSDLVYQCVDPRINFEMKS